MEGITPEQVNAYFTNLDILLYCFVGFVLMIAYYQWKWWKTCRDNIQVVLVHSDGSTTIWLSPKAGNELTVELTNGEVRDWLITDLACIDKPYPGKGFVPTWAQRTIREVTVLEGDIEPLTNRSTHRRSIMSPDMVDRLKEIAELSDEKTKAYIDKVLKNVRTAPTREIIASPAILGNLMREKVTAMVSTISKEILDPIAGLSKKLDKLPNSTVVYIGLGLIAVGLIYIIFNVVPSFGETIERLDAIEQALGVIKGGG